LKPAFINWKRVHLGLFILLGISPYLAAAQKTAPDVKSAADANTSVTSQLPKIWYSEASKKDFQVEVTKDLFRADWVNIPSAAAKQGAYIHTACRRSGTKWAGSSQVYQAVATSKDPKVKDIKMCHLTVRFEVDAITPQKITFHSEALRNFDPAKCQLLQTAWEEFSWIPKK
jgi:hypothetical protein